MVRFLNLACFGDLKRRKRRKSANNVSSTNHIHKVTEAISPLGIKKQEIQQNPNRNADSLEKVDKQRDWCFKSELAFAPAIDIGEEVSIGKVINNSVEIKKEEKRGQEDDVTKGGDPGSNFSDALCRPASGKPTQHRYADCSSSDDDDYVEEGDHLDAEEEEEEEEKEKEEIDDDDDYDDDDVKSKIIIQESSESLFSLSVDSRKQNCTVEAGEKEVNSPVPSHRSLDVQNTGDRSQNVDFVLNSIENVTPWNAAKVKTTLPPIQYLEKENINLENDYDVPISPEPVFNRSTRKFDENYSDFNPREDGIAVDTSLSNWLVESETTPKSKSSSSSICNSPLGTRNSVKSYEDRPILGALTVEELRQFSAFSTPRRSRSPSPSPDDLPIIGSVGSYWNHTGQDANSYPGSSCSGVTKTTRRNREDERVNWNSTPFLERLDKALASNSAEV